MNNTKKVTENKIENVNKERRYILFGIFSLIGLIKGFGAISGTNKNKKNVGTFVLANALWKIIALIRFILKV